MKRNFVPKKTSRLNLNFLILALMLAVQPVIGEGSSSVQLLQSFWIRYIEAKAKYEPSSSPPIYNAFDQLNYGVDRDNLNPSPRMTSPINVASLIPEKALNEIANYYGRVLVFALASMKEGDLSARQFNDLMIGKLDLRNYEGDESIKLNLDAFNAVLDGLLLSANRASQAATQAEPKPGNSPPGKWGEYYEAKSVSIVRRRDFKDVVDLSKDLGLITDPQSNRPYQRNTEWRGGSVSCETIFLSLGK